MNKLNSSDGDPSRFLQRIDPELVKALEESPSLFDGSLSLEQIQEKVKETQPELAAPDPRVCREDKKIPGSEDHDLVRVRVYQLRDSYCARPNSFYLLLQWEMGGYRAIGRLGMTMVAEPRDSKPLNTQRHR